MIKAPAHPSLPETLHWIGHDLVRPECVLVDGTGTLYASDWRGGVSIIQPDGRTTFLQAHLGDGGPPLRPNGIARRADGSFLLADLSEARAGVWHLAPDGRATPFLHTFAGKPLPPTNFILSDTMGRVWVTVSTHLSPRSLDYRPDAHSGFILLIQGDTVRQVADGLGYTNECRLSPDGTHLYVNETFARRTTRFRITPSGDLTDRTSVAEYGPGDFPDGLAFDPYGRLWATSIVSNRVYLLHPDGPPQCILEDADANHLTVVEAAFQDKRLGRPHLDMLPSCTLRSVSSIAFSDERMYLGCLLGNRIASFALPA